MTNQTQTRPTVVDRFRAAMATLEDSGSTDELVDLYASDCRLGNVVHPEAFDGHDGVVTFWTRYRDQFDRVRSEYGVVVGDDHGAVLEWTTTGTAAGAEVRYRGSTVLEIADGRIVRSTAYFEPSDLGEQVVGSAATATTDVSSADEAPAAPRPSTGDGDGDGATDAGWSGPAEAGEPAPESVR